jgi:hypothetical protein
MAALVSTSLAYFTAGLVAEGNIIGTGSIEYEVIDLYYTADSPEGMPPVDNVIEVAGIFPGETVLRSVSAANRGATPLYVRARIDCDITLAEGYKHLSGEIDKSLITYGINGDAWMRAATDDGYYYYTAPLSKGATTPSFIDRVSFSKAMGNMYKDAVIKVRVTIEMVQANDNGATVFDAIGWPAAEQGGSGE